MHKILACFVLLTFLFSCNKQERIAEKKRADTLRMYDSINQLRMKRNDSITKLNNENRYGDLSGTHAISYRFDNVQLKGEVKMQKVGRDLYDISGGAKSGNNHLNIVGKIKRVSDIYLNFEGEISQNINGVPYKRTKKTTFGDEKIGNFWRLQDKVNGEGFIEYIDIYK